MKKGITSILLSMFCPFLFGQTNTTGWDNLFSSEYALDFLNTGYQVKLAPSGENGKTRVWVKGSQSYQIVSYKNERDSLVFLKLLSPYFTTIIEFNSSNAPITIHFSKKENETNTKELIVFPKANINSNKYSILVYSCYQPFEFEKGKFVPDLNSNKANYKIRDVFNKVALSHHFSTVNLWVKGKGVILKDTTFPSIQLLNDPALLIGIGDQVYVDAGYDEKKNLKFLPWEVGVKPQLKEIMKPNEYPSYLNSLYENFYSFTSMQSVFQHIPSLNMWDDHEIRDGWGSHGDEYKSTSLMQAYTCSKEAFVKNMYLHPSPLNINYLSPRVDLSHFYETPKADVFLFDLRSNRDVNTPNVIDSIQWKKFEDWCNKLPNNRTIILGSSIPVFWKVKEKMAGAYIKITDGEAQDDINDAWGSSYNQVQRDRLITKILELRLTKNIKTIIISGDIHIGCLSEIWYNPEPTDRNKRQVLCYEMITSGLSHESLKGSISDVWVLKKSEGQRTNETLTTITYNGQRYKIDNTVKVSEAYHNFGGINFKAEKIELQLFVKRPKEDRVHDYILNCNWDKTNLEEEKFEKSKWWSPSGNTYTPAPIDWFYDFEIK